MTFRITKHIVRSVRKMRMRYALMMCIVLPAAFTAGAEPMHITLPDTILKPGDVELLAVKVDSIASEDAVLSGEFTLDFNRSVITIGYIETAGTLLEDVGNVMYNATTGRIAFAATDTVSGSGTLFYLSVKMEDDSAPGTSTDLEMNEVMFNEGEPEAAVSAGLVRSPQIVISPSGPTVIEGDEITFSISGDVHPPVSWSVTNEDIATVDENGVLTGYEPGTIRVFAEDAIGLQDSTDLFRVEPDLLRELTVSTPDTSVRQTREFWWTVEVTDVTDLNITSVQFELNWPSQHIEFLDVSTSGTLLEEYGFGSVEYDHDPGELRVAAAGTDPLAGSGAIVHLKLRIHDDASGNRTPSFQQMFFNEDLEPDLDLGKISIVAAPEIFVTPKMVEFVIGETRDLEVDEGGAAPYTWESDDPSVVTVDENTGELTAINRGTAEVFAIDDEEFYSHPAEVTVYDVNILLGDSTLVYPDVLTVPVITDDLTGLDIFAFEMSVAIDTNMVNFEGVETSGSLSDDMTISSNISDGVLMIAAAGINELDGGGELISLKFSAGDSARNHDTMLLDFKRMELNDPGVDSPTALPHDGSITITGFPTTPEPVQPEKDAEDVALRPEFKWKTEFGELFDLQVATDETFNNLMIDEAGLSDTTFVPGDDLDYESSHWWRVRANTGGVTSDWSDTLHFMTVPTPPDAPAPAAPEDGLKDVEPPITLYWFAIAEADSYRVQLATDEDFVDVVIEEVVTESNSPVDTTLTVEDLEEETTYHWQVRAYRGVSAGDWSDSRSFTTLMFEPEPADPAEPQDEAEDVTLPVTFSWHPGGHAESYHLQIHTSDDFNSPIFDSTGIADTLITVDLDEQTGYFWKIRSERDGEVSDWSSIWSFETLTFEPEPVELVSPDDGETGVQEPFNLMWNEAELADSYHIQLSDEPGFSNLLVDSSGVSDTLYTLDVVLDPLETYYWQVRSERENLTSDWSEVFEFETVAETGTDSMAELPDEVELDQNYPNPFNPATSIRYGLPTESEVTLDVYNVTGQRVATLVDGRQSAGRHEVTFDASRFSSGLYIYRLRTESQTLTRQLLLVK